MNEQRSSQRKRVETTIQVSNAITGQWVGHIGNLSVEGMLLISDRQLPDNALFQFIFQLPDPDSGRSHKLEVGVHEQWSEAANVPGQFWTGFRIIDISPQDYEILYDWVMGPERQSD